jgi:TonB family protein
LRWFDGGTDISHIPLHSPSFEVVVSSNPVLPGIVPLPSGPHAATAPRSERATPVPVPDGMVSPDQTMATQAQLSEAVEPRGIPGEGGGKVTQISVPPANDETPVPFEAVEKIPMVVSRGTLVYPPVAIRAGIEGKVIVKLLVGKDGLVRDAKIEVSTADILNEAALAAARESRFTPAVMNSGPVPVWMLMTFTFRLK